MHETLIAAVLCIAIPAIALVGDSGYKVIYNGGSIPDTKSGTDVKPYIESNQIRSMKGRTELATIPTSAITETSYGQDVHRRVGTAIAVVRSRLA